MAEPDCDYLTEEEAFRGMDPAEALHALSQVQEVLKATSGNAELKMFTRSSARTDKTWAGAQARRSFRFADNLLLIVVGSKPCESYGLAASRMTAVGFAGSFDFDVNMSQKGRGWFYCVVARETRHARNAGPHTSARTDRPPPEGGG